MRGRWCVALIQASSSAASTGRVRSIRELPDARRALSYSEFRALQPMLKWQQTVAGFVLSALIDGLIHGRAIGASNARLARRWVSCPYRHMATRLSAVLTPQTCLFCRPPLGILPQRFYCRCRPRKAGAASTPSISTSRTRRSNSTPPTRPRRPCAPWRWACSPDGHWVGLTSPWGSLRLAATHAVA